jgi:hypothetical protein
MKRFTLLIVAIFIFVAQNAMAHSGHKEEASPIAISEPSATDPMYANEEKESDPFGGSGLFSPSDLFVQGEVVADEPANEAMKMEGSHNENADHEMPKVESAKIKTVETSSKGYGIAAGITFCAGLLFAGLTFIRPGE